MTRRLRGLGIVLAIFGIVFVAGGAYAFLKVQEGTASLNAFSTAQGVELRGGDSTRYRTAPRKTSPG